MIATHVLLATKALKHLSKSVFQRFDATNLVNFAKWLVQPHKCVIMGINHN